MKLTDLDNNPIVTASKALKQNYRVPFNVGKMNMTETTSMLRKIRTLLGEARDGNQFYKQQASPAYMKLVFMEQALVNHGSELAARPKARIVFENEEVEKSQVVLAAQDLVDSVQKMLEEVGQMQVKELPALVSSIESEIGVNESQTYNEQVSTQLDTLSASLKEVYAGLKEALNTVTGQGGAPAEFAAGEEDLDTGMDDLDAGMGDLDMGDEDMTDMSEMPPEELEAPEADMTGDVGRAKR